MKIESKSHMKTLQIYNVVYKTHEAKPSSIIFDKIDILEIVT